MRNAILHTVAVAALLALASVCVAAESKPSAPPEAAGSVKAPEKKTASPKQAPVAVKPVDINSASKAALRKLPGITDAEADKIVAGRPYGSKAWLVTRNVISGVQYAQIKDLIIARQK